MSLANKFGIPESLLDAAKKALDEANEYQKKVQAHMAKKGIKSMNDMTPDQKKKFFNELDAMHKAKNEEVELDEEQLDELSKDTVASYAGKAGRTLGGDIQALSKAKEIGQMSYPQKSADQVKATLKKSIANRKAGLDRAEKRLSKNEEVEHVEEAESHQAKTTMKHISKPTAGEKKAAKDIKPGVAGYRDRVAMLKSAEARGALKKEEVELTQEDLDFIASLNQAEVVEGQLRNFSPHSDLAGRGRLSGYNKTAAGKKREADRETERLKDKMKFTKSQGGIAGPKGKLPEEFELDDFTVEEIEEYMQTEEFAQLDELSKETLGSYIKKRQHDVAAQGAITRQHAVDAEKAKKDNNYSQQRKSNEKSDKAFAKGWKYRQNISKAVDKIVKKA